MVDCVAPIYLPGSYNGVFFDTEVAGSEHGRRGVTGEFPFGENTRFQDMGRKIRKFSIKGRFQGPLSIELSNLLIAAVETPGPGTLVHPTRGVLTVSCASLKITDDIVAGAGETNFDMDCIDASSSPTGLVGLPVIPSIIGILGAVADSITSNYVIDLVPFFQKSVITQTAVSTLLALSTSLSNVLPPLNNTIDVWQAVYQTQANATNDETWRTASAMSDAFAFGFAALDAYSSDPQTEYDTCLSLVNQYAQSATVGGAAGQCQEALFSAIRITCAAYMLRAAMQISSVTLEDALAKLDAVQLIITEEMANAIILNNNELVITLTDFEAMALQALTNNAYNLPPVISYNFVGGIPSLVAAHEIYGDATQNQQLELRNPFNFPFALGPVIYALGTSK